MSSENYNPNSIDSKLTRIETKLDQVITNQTSLDARVTVLERWRYYVLGAFAVAGIGAKFIFDVLK